MISPKIAEEVNKQIHHELTNAYAYKGVALYFESLNLHGIAAFMFKQSGEEYEHGEKLIKHLVARNARVKLESLPSIPTTYPNPLDAIKIVHAMEIETTQRIYALYKLARVEDDLALQGILNWYVAEQVEEEEWSTELLDLMEQFHANPGQLRMLDHHWGKKA